jgi:CheY-like chemotaxis protein
MNTVKRILIVEDREDHQKIFQEVVSSLGYQPEIAATKEESFMKLNRMSFHVALVDLRLDETDDTNWDGFKVLARIKAMNEGTQMIVLTNFGEVEQSSEAFREYKVFDFIRKQKMLVLDVKDKIHKAAEEADIDKMRPEKLYLDIPKFFKGQPIFQPIEIIEKNSEDFVASIRHTQELGLFLKRLFGKLSPILPSKQDQIEHLIDSHKRSVRVRFWSKALGCPVEAWFGKFSDMQNAIQMTDQSPDAMQANGYVEKVNDVFDTGSFPDFGGSVYSLRDVSFDEFDIPSYPTL